MNLTQHFTLDEFTRSEKAARFGIDNTPPAQVIEELKRSAMLMEDARRHLNNPIFITSGYRCSAVNKLVGSKPTSKHVQGLAVDFVCPAYGNPLRVCESIRDSDLHFGKLILEFFNPATGDGWVHIEVGTERKILTINSFGTFAGLHP